MANLLSIKFPFQRGTSSFPTPTNDDEAIRASLIQILSTAKGERVMSPSFGCAVNDFVFENDSIASANGLEREIRSAIGTWEPRVTINKVDIDMVTLNEEGSWLATIYYTILQTGVNDVITVGGG